MSNGLPTERIRKSWKLEATLLQRENKELKAEIKNLKSNSTKPNEEAGKLQTSEEVSRAPIEKSSESESLVLSDDKTEETKPKKEEVETANADAETSLKTLSISEKGEDSGENLTDTSQTSSLEIADVNEEEEEEDEELLGCPVCNTEFKQLKNGCCPNCNEELA